MQAAMGLYRLFTLIIFILATSSTFVHAAPISPPARDASLFPRGLCPSLSEIRIDIKARTQNGAKNTVFYTSPADDKEALAFAKSLKPVGNTWLNVVDDQLFNKYKTRTGTDEAEAWKIVDRISTVLAQEATGTAYLVSKGNVNKAKVWWKYEFPRIQVNSKVDKVYQYDLITKKQTLIWTKGTQPFLPLLEP
ncbi:hypothetical protein NMY22_g1466 [Coprinellus aureogranulatus]|nr:hypothetical protein NMY22_g1466 [Coprinellus aureogranulatus]